MVRPGERVGVGGAVGTVHAHHRAHHRAVQEVVVVLIQRRQGGIFLGVETRDVRALCVHAVDEADDAVLLGLQRGGDGKVAAARFAGDDDRGDAQLVTVIAHPLEAAHAIVEPGRERVRAHLAATVSELDADDDETGRCQFVAPADIAGIGCLENHHATTVGVDDARPWFGDIGRAVDVEADVVAVDPSDDLGATLDVGDLGRIGSQHGAQCTEPFFGQVGVFQERIDW